MKGLTVLATYIVLCILFFFPLVLVLAPVGGRLAHGLSGQDQTNRAELVIFISMIGSPLVGIIINYWGKQRNMFEQQRVLYIIFGALLFIVAVLLINHLFPVPYRAGL